MSTIRAGTTLTTALVSTGDTTGNIVLQPDSGLASISATGAFGIPSGTTAQRPASPVVGQMRYNTTTGYMEYFSATGWQTVAAPYSTDVLVVAGGGAALYASGASGGSGAGGLCKAVCNCNLEQHTQLLLAQVVQVQLH